mmetsp:Transcript_23301/g.72920  ORF Transcript_23301/g.72920 Transcript_23301/m.72920 type:complete len:524 (+) Transcript_23301:3377-4948(+)
MRRPRVHVGVPAAEVALPEVRLLDGGARPQHALVLAVSVVREVRFVGEHVRPDRLGARAHLVLALALLLRVPEEVPEQARELVIRDEYQQSVGKLEGVRELLAHLVHDLDPLQEDGGALLVGRIVHAVAAALLELVAKGAPVFLDEHGEALDGPVVGVQEQLRRGAELRRAVPAVAAVDKHGVALRVHLLGDEDARLEHEAAVPRPGRVLEAAEEAVLLGALRRVAGRHEVREGGEGGAHVVDVLDVAELQRRVLVARRGLHALALDAVPQRRERLARVHDPKLPGPGLLRGVAGVASHAQQLQQPLVCLVSVPADARHGLRAPRHDGAAERVAVGHRRHAVLAAVLGRRHDLALAQQPREHEDPRVRRAERVVVGVDAPPVVHRLPLVDEPLAHELPLGVINAPAVPRRRHLYAVVEGKCVGRPGECHGLDDLAEGGHECGIRLETQGHHARVLAAKQHPVRVHHARLHARNGAVRYANLPHGRRPLRARRPQVRGLLVPRRARRHGHVAAHVGPEDEAVVG